jgi:hypothetical protein
MMKSPLRILVFSFVMVMAAAMANAVMDTLATRYDRSVFARLPSVAQPWLNPAISWPNKWKNGDRIQGEAFPLSSTALVFTTDAWHFFKLLAILCLYAALFAPFTLLFRWRWYCWVLLYFAFDIPRGLLFELLYARLLS